jgi:drug/metabolite transporter (DMT)-like permease
LITAVIALALEHPWTVRPAAASVGAIVWLGVLGSGLAYLAFFRLLGRWGATRTAAVAYLLPVVGIVLGAMVLSEPIDARTIAGTLLIIGGVSLVNSGQLVFARLRGFPERSPTALDARD